MIWKWSTSEKILFQFIFLEMRTLRLAANFSSFCTYNTVVHFTTTEVNEERVTKETKEEYGGNVRMNKTNSISCKFNPYIWQVWMVFMRHRVLSQNQRKESICLFTLFLILFCSFTNEHQLVLLNSEELRSKNREQLIEKLERVIQEKNASITKLEDR